MAKREKNSPQDEYSILPDEELRELYKADKRKQKICSLPMLPAAILTAISLKNIAEGALDFRSEGSPYPVILFFIMCALGFVGTTQVLTEKPKVQTKMAFITAGGELVLMLFCLLTRGIILSGIALGMAAGLIGQYFVYRPIIKDMEILKAHPRYPFDNWRRDDTYINRVSYEDAVKYIGNTVGKGSVKSVGGDEFFEGKARAYEEPKPDPEKNLQQRKQVWRGHDKSETGYTLDNMKNMYFDAPDEGELSGKELERELMKATAPKKVPEPTPEDFFQSSPVIWRTNRDGTTTIEHRAPGSKPVGDFDSRSVLP